MNVKVRDGLVNMEMRPEMLNKVMGSGSKKKKTLVFCFDSVVLQLCPLFMKAAAVE